jgi:hypothetical protein
MTLQGVLTTLPVDDIVAAMKDPSNLGKEAKVAEDLVGTFAPGIAGPVAAALIALFVAWVYASGGGTITPDPLPMTNAQTTQSRGGRNA